MGTIKVRHECGHEAQYGASSALLDRKDDLMAMLVARPCPICEMDAAPGMDETDDQGMPTPVELVLHDLEVRRQARVTEFLTMAESLADELARDISTLRTENRVRNSLGPVQRYGSQLDRLAGEIALLDEMRKVVEVDGRHSETHVPAQ